MTIHHFQCDDIQRTHLLKNARIHITIEITIPPQLNESSLAKIKVKFLFSIDPSLYALH